MEGVVTEGEKGVVPDMPEPAVPQCLALSLLSDRNLHHKVRALTDQLKLILEATPTVVAQLVYSEFSHYVAR